LWGKIAGGCSSREGGKGAEKTSKTKAGGKKEKNFSKLSLILKKVSGKRKRHGMRGDGRKRPTGAAERGGSAPGSHPTTNVHLHQNVEWLNWVVLQAAVDSPSRGR